MLNEIVALLIMQAVIGKVPVAPPPPPSPELVGKAQSASTPAPAPASRACIEMPDAAYLGARNMAWFIDGEAVTLGKLSYVKYGLPRVLSSWDVAHHATARAALFYAEPGVPDPSVIYLLLDPASCEFQPYQLDG